MRTTQMQISDAALNRARARAQAAVSRIEGDAQSDELPLAGMAIPQETKKPTGLTRCKDCEKGWTGFRTCHCTVCHETFAGVNLFDRHRRDVNGKGNCLDPADVTVPNPKSKRFGEREMFLTGEIWQSVEEPAEKGLALRAYRGRAS